LRIIFLLSMLSTTLAAAAPSIESASDGSVIISVAEGATVMVQELDANGKVIGSQTPLITQAMLEDAKATMRDEMADMLLELKKTVSENSEAAAQNFTKIQKQFGAAADSVDVATEAVMAAANTAIKAVADDLDAAVDDLNSISSKSNSCMGDLAHAAGGAFESCPESDTDEPKQCPEITGISGGGTVHGSDRHIGATRGFSCDDGSVLVGAKHVYCQSDQTWSPEIPKCDATVTCAIVIDNAVTGIFIDGSKESSIVECTHRYDITFRGQRQCSFSFPSSAKTLAITGFDGEKGCAMGGLVLSCGSSDKSSPWSSFSSQSGTLVGSSNLWKAFGSADEDAITGDAWKGPDFDDSKWPAPVSTGQVGTHICAKRADDGRKFAGCRPETDRDGNELGLSIYCEKRKCNPGNAADEEYVSRICADESNAFNFEGGKKTYWWFRVTI